MSDYNAKLKMFAWGVWQGAFNMNVPGYDQKKVLSKNQFDSWWELNKENVLKLCGGDVRGIKIVVVPVSQSKGTLVAGIPQDGFTYERYRGWQGTILGDGKCGEQAGYRVKISRDEGLSYVTTTIRKEDIQFLSEKNN